MNINFPIILQEQQGELKNTIQFSEAPPFPERLTLERPIIPLEFDILVELRTLCVKYP